MKCPYWFFVNYNRKPSGLPDSNVIFFVATKKTKQKKVWRWAGFTRGILLAKVTGRDLCRSTHPPLGPRPLRTSGVEQADRFLFFQSLLVDDSKIKSARTKERVSQEARVLENSSLFQRFTQSYKRSRQQAKMLPSAGRRHFCILLLPGKSMASDGTRAAGFACSLAKDHRQQLKDLLL